MQPCFYIATLREHDAKLNLMAGQLLLYLGGGAPGYNKAYKGLRKPS